VIHTGKRKGEDDSEDSEIQKFDSDDSDKCFRFSGFLVYQMQQIYDYFDECATYFQHENNFR